MYTYSKKVVPIWSQGTPPAMVQAGNEINAGLLWPDGSTSDWPSWRAAQGRDRRRERGRPRTKIALHLAGSADLATLESWYTTAIADGVSFDVIGLSYYAYWDGRLDVLQTDLDGLAAKYGKPVMVAETAYPWTLATTPAA